ncbi:carbon storage regulator [Alteromonadaceae bacterium M269]|nr:carbon storage regulator [Alteromonadaceae bacterium M269]
MLVITRRVGEKLMIGDDISVVVLDVGGSQVRMGIRAPNNIDVYREEIYLKIWQKREEQADGL